MPKLSDIMVTSLDEIIAFTMSGDHRFTLDELQDATIANTQESTDITGKMGRLLSSINTNKAVTVSGTNGMLNLGLISADTGTDVQEDTAANVMWMEFCPVVVEEDTATATLQYTPVGTTGAEISAVYIKDSAGFVTKKLAQDATAATGKFSYTNKVITFATGDVTDGDTAVVYYMRRIVSTIAGNDSGKYSETLRLYIDATGEDKCGNEYHIQFIIYKAKFTGNFDITMGTDQSTHAFEANALASSGCGEAAGNGRYWDMIIFGADAADAPAA